MRRFFSSKTYPFSVGLSCCFRQWPATHSHCSQVHGYALQVSLRFEANKLDTRNWVVDFGDLKIVKDWLTQMFDHKTLVAQDDPHIDAFREMGRLGLMDIRVVKATGCEAFADMIADVVEGWLVDHAPHARLTEVEVREHDGNAGGVTLGEI